MQILASTARVASSDENEKYGFYMQKLV